MMGLPFNSHNFLVLDIGHFKKELEELFLTKWIKKIVKIVMEIIIY